MVQIGAGSVSSRSTAMNRRIVIATCVCEKLRSRIHAYRAIGSSHFIYAPFILTNGCRNTFMSYMILHTRHIDARPIDAFTVSSHLFYLIILFNYSFSHLTFIVLDLLTFNAQYLVLVLNVHLSLVKSDTLSITL